MQARLFYPDNQTYFDLGYLRQSAADLVRGLSLIRRAREGDKAAAIGLKIGFWPFVREFERAIDQQALPREPLARKFGDPVMRRVFIWMARAVREMKSEEGSHAAHWRKDAEGLGIIELGNHRVPGVQALIDRAYTQDLPSFFALLAGTEFIAEELSRFLIDAEDFSNLFTRKRWVWGEVHMAPHDRQPSHLEIDLDLARAYDDSKSPAAVEQMVLDTIRLFGTAANEVEEFAAAADWMRENVF
jgi:hypothetical protein